MAPNDDALDDGREAPPPGKQDASSLSRRDFLKTVGAAGVATTAVGANTSAGAQVARPPRAGGAPTSADRPYMRIRQEVAENLVKRGIVGYADRLRIQPGETIKFMVSSEQPRYRADIVRLIHGDANPKGPGIKEVVVDTPANGEYAGTRQVLPLGSYAIVADNTALRISGSFTFTAWIAPTSQRGADGFEGVEGILTKWAGAARGGYAIVVDESGRLALWLTDPAGRTEKLQAAAALRPWVPAIPGMNQRPQGVATAWYFVAVSFDAGSGRVILHQDPINEFPFDESRGTTEQQTAIRSLAGHDAPLLMGALWEAGRPSGFFNGKLDSPRLYRRTLTPAEIVSVRQGKPP
jgi:Concanavalin A-like lectin/glucanases superfamily